MKRITQGQFLSFVWIIFLQYVAVGANQCTQVLSRNEVRNVLKQVPCIEKYQARCAWLSLNYCTFYHTTLCDKNVTESVKTYFIKTDCCEGYFKAKNGSCIKMRPGIDYEKLMPTSTTTSEDPTYVRASIDRTKKVDSVEPVITGGGYAGIICGMVLVVSIISFIVISIRKRKKRKITKPDPATQVLYIPAPTTPIVKSNFKQQPQQQSSFQRENTPSSSHRVTPPDSPISITVVTPPRSPVKTPTVTPPKSPTEIQTVDSPPETNSMPVISEDHSFDTEATPLNMKTTHPDSNDMPLDSEATPLDSEATPLESEATPLESEATPLYPEAPPDDSADTPLMFNVDKLGDDNLPESDI